MRAGLAVAAAVGIAAVAACVGEDFSGTNDTVGPDGADGGEAPGFEAGTSADADAPPDAEPESAPPACDRTKPFTTPETALPQNTAGGLESGARFSADELSLFFGRDIVSYVATRSRVEDPFGPAVPIPGLSEPYTGHITTTPDGLRAFFSSVRTGSNGLDIFEASRTKDSLAWKSVKPVVSFADNDDHPFLRHDGRVLYFESPGANGGGANGIDIFRADISVSGVVGKPVRVADPNINTVADETNPIVTADELTIYFSRFPGSNIYSASRNKVADTWGPSAPVQELNSVSSERMTWISPDGCRALFWSLRSGKGDLFMATKPK